MTRNTEKRIQEAIDNGQKNLHTMELVRNWCGHVSIKKFGGTGIVEAQTGLPIGHHSLSCPHAPASGMATWDLADAAIDFYDRNCHDCKLRKPVRLPNILSLITARDARRKEMEAQRVEADLRENRALAARDGERARIRVGLDPAAASNLDLISDVDHGLGDSPAARLVAAAKLAPESFGIETINHLFAAVDGNITRLVEPALRTLNELNVDPARLCNAALKALAHHNALYVAGDIVGRFGAQAEPSKIAHALPALISLARPERTPFHGRQPHVDERPLLAIYKAFPREVCKALEAILAKRRTSFVASAARGISVLAKSNPDVPVSFARTLAAKLVRKNRLLPDLDEYDESLYDIRKPLVKALLRDPEAVDAILQSFLAGADSEGQAEVYAVYAAILREDRFDERRRVLSAAHEVAFQRLIWDAAKNPGSAAAEEAQQVFSDLPGFLEPLAVKQLDQLLGAAALINDTMEKLDASGNKREHDTLAALEWMNERGRGARLQSGYLKWACHAASGNVANIRRVLNFYAALPEERDHLRAEVVAHFAQMMRTAEGMAEVLPSLYSALVGASVRLRGSAADAVAELRGNASKNLPELVFEAIVAQLSDPYVMVHRSAVHVLEQMKFPTAYDVQVDRCLRTLIVVYANNRDADEFLLTCIELLVRRYAEPARLEGRLGAGLVEILQKMRPYVVAKELRFLARFLRAAEGYVPLLCRLLRDDEAMEYYDRVLAEEILRLSPSQIAAYVSELQDVAEGLKPHRQYMSGYFIEAFTRANLWDAAASVAKHRVRSIEDIIRDKPLRLLARLQEIACLFEQHVAAGRLDALSGLSQEWNQTAAELEQDHETQKTRRDPLLGLLSKN